MFCLFSVQTLCLLEGNGKGEYIVGERRLYRTTAIHNTITEMKRSNFCELFFCCSMPARWLFEFLWFLRRSSPFGLPLLFFRCLEFKIKLCPRPHLAPSTWVTDIMRWTQFPFLIVSLNENVNEMSSWISYIGHRSTVPLPLEWKLSSALPLTKGQKTMTTFESNDSHYLLQLGKLLSSLSPLQFHPRASHPSISYHFEISISSWKQHDSTPNWNNTIILQQKTNIYRENWKEQLHIETGHEMNNWNIYSNIIETFKFSFPVN